MSDSENQVGPSLVELASSNALLQAELSVAREDLSLAQHGLVDDEARAVARALYSRAPAGESGERPQIADWLQSITADPDAIPRALRAYLPESTTTRTTPRATGTAAETAPAAPGAIEQRLEEARRAVQGGDYSQEAQANLRAALDAWHQARRQS